MTTVNELPARFTPTFYVLGNGPSLTTRVIGALPHGSWLGMNSAFRYWHKVAKYPRYYACLDPVVLKSQFEGIRALLELPDITDFFLHDCAVELDGRLAAHPKVTLLSHFLAKKNPRVAISRLGHEKQTTGALAARFVIEKGHRNLMLIGIDCKYVEQVQGAAAAQGIELVITKKITSNPNYFFGDYQAAGDRYQVPNPTIHSGNLHLQSFVALRNDLDAAAAAVTIRVGSDRSLLSRFGIFPTQPIWGELGIRRIGTIAVPLTPKEWRRQIQNLRLWMDPRFRPSMDAGSKGTCLHLFISGHHDEVLKNDIEAGLREIPGLDTFFSACRITFLEIPSEIDHYIRSTAATDDPCTKSGPNIFFLATMAHCKEYEYVLHAETDCLPVRAGWLDAAEREIERAGTQAWIIGPAYFGPSQLHSAYRMHINGNAIYQTGDPDFQSFLQGTFLETLAHLIRSGFRDMAYDTSLSVAFYNLDVLPDSLRKELSLALPRFSHSNFIRNVGGSRETADPSLLDLKSLLEETDQTFMLHGRPGFHFLDGDRTYLPEVYRSLPSVPEESLPLFYVWTNDTGWTVDQQGYGKVDLTGSDVPPPASAMLTFHFARLRDGTTGRRWRLRLVAEGSFPAFARATFAFQRSDGQVVQFEPGRTDVDREGDTQVLRFELDEAPPSSANAVGVYLHGLAVRPSHLALRCIEMIESDTAALQRAGMALHVVPRSATSLEAIERWHDFYDALPRFGSQVNQPHWVHWQSARYLLRHAALRAKLVNLTIASVDARGSAQMTGSHFTGVLAGAPWHRASAFHLHLRVSDATVNGDAVIRICRHAHTPWEYVDIKVPLCAGFGSGNLDRAAFTQEHQSYRIELISMPDIEGAVTMTIELAVTLPEEALDNRLGPPRAGRLPRLLILDPTIMGTRSATGQIKQLFFGAWEGAEVLQVCDLRQPDGKLGLVRFEKGKPTWSAQTAEDVLAECRRFSPDVMYVRPDDSEHFMEQVHRIVHTLERPFALHVMDDWMERARQTRTEAYGRLQTRMVQLVRRASSHLSICQDMSRMLAARYGTHWIPLANGVDVVDHGPRAPRPEPFVIRYMGGLAEDMSLGTVQLVSEAVDRLRHRIDIRFEIHTMSWYKELAFTLFSNHPATLVGDLVEADAYLPHLASAGALLIAYNFDDASRRYTRYSFSNKLPECLASGRPVLLVGPCDVSSVRELQEQRGLEIVTTPDVEAIVAVLEHLAADPTYADSLGIEGQALARRRFNAAQVRAQAQEVMRQVARRAPESPPHPDQRPAPSFKGANLRLRAGQYEQALSEYARLMAIRPLDVYRENALTCIRRLGLDEGTWEQAVDVWRVGQ